MEKTLSLNRHISLTHRCTIKEESKVANRDWVDHQACSLLQYINVIANPFKMGFFLMKCAKNIRANNLLQYIHQVTIKFRFLKTPWRKRDLSPTWNLDTIIVSSVKFRKGFAKFMIPIALFKKFLR